MLYQAFLIFSIFCPLLNFLVKEMNVFTVFPVVFFKKKRNIRGEKFFDNNGPKNVSLASQKIVVFFSVSGVSLPFCLQQVVSLAPPTCSTSSVTAQIFSVLCCQYQR